MLGCENSERRGRRGASNNVVHCPWRRSAPSQNVSRMSCEVQCPPTFSWAMLLRKLVWLFAKNDLVRLIKTKEECVRIHGHSPLTAVKGFHPMRGSTEKTYFFQQATQTRFTALSSHHSQVSTQTYLTSVTCRSYPTAWSARCTNLQLHTRTKTGFLTAYVASIRLGAGKQASWLSKEHTVCVCQLFPL